MSYERFSNDDFITETGEPLSGTVDEMTSYVEDMGFPLRTAWELNHSDGRVTRIETTRNGWFRMVLQDSNGNVLESPVIPVSFLKRLVE